MIDPGEFYIKLANEAGQLLKKNNQTIAVAESVTAGQLQVSLSLADQAMDFFQGGITAYNLGQKSKHLCIDPINALCNDCVSEPIASKMASAVATLFNCNWGIGITGYASPVPEKNIEELFACYALTRDGVVLECETIGAEKMEPLAVRQFYTHHILGRLVHFLNNNG